MYRHDLPNKKSILADALASQLAGSNAGLGLPAGLDHAGQFAFVGAFAQLVATEAEIAVKTAGFAGGQV